MDIQKVLSTVEPKSKVVSTKVCKYLQPCVCPSWWVFKTTCFHIWVVCLFSIRGQLLSFLWVVPAINVWLHIVTVEYVCLTAWFLYCKTLLSLCYLVFRSHTSTIAPLYYIQFQLNFQPRKPQPKPFNNFNLSLRTKLHAYILISESLINFYDSMEALSGQYAQSKKFRIFEFKYTVFLFQTSYRTL